MLTSQLVFKDSNNQNPSTSNNPRSTVGGAETGTGPGRSGFGSQLSLSYDSGAGNGPFGFGWSLSLPTITRKTDKELPRYLDTEESDVFILSGSEDLVPVLGEANGLAQELSTPAQILNLAHLERLKKRDGLLVAE